MSYHPSLHRRRVGGERSRYPRGHVVANGNVRAIGHTSAAAHADGAIPFNLSGWTMISTGKEYDGWLRNGDVQLEACDCRSQINTIVLDGQ